MLHRNPRPANSKRRFVTRKYALLNHAEVLILLMISSPNLLPQKLGMIEVFPFPITIPD